MVLDFLLREYQFKKHPKKKKKLTPLSHHKLLLKIKNRKIIFTFFFLETKKTNVLENCPIRIVVTSYSGSQIICHASHCLKAQPSSGKWGYNLHLGININIGFFFLNGTYKKKKKKMISTQLTLEIRHTTN